ncbi:MAG: hypothetical protein ABSE90_06620, partial [Verrucomicrobiota bacterium]
MFDVSPPIVMNPDKPSREQIEARITALLLGELPAEEAELLRWTISQDAELQKLHGRLLLTIGLVREVVGHPEEASAEKAVPRNLSDERRQKLLAYFKTPRPRQASGELFWLKRIEVRPLVTALALVAILGMLAAMFLPALASAKRKAQNVTALSMAKQKALEERIQAEENPPASVRAAPLPVAVMPPPPPAVTLAVAPPPPTEIVLPRGGEPTSIESEKGTVLSAQIVGYANSAVPATPQAQATPNVALSLGRAVDVGDLFDRKQSKTENAGVISELARSGGNSGGNGGGGGGFGGFGIGGASSSQNSALQQRQQNGVTTMSSTTANSGIGGVSGVGGGSAETSVVNKRVDQFGIAEPVANATPTDTTLAWNVSVTDRSRTENQSENDWHGGTSLGPVPNGGDVAALQNKSQIVGGETFYRSQNGEVAAEKEKTPVLGDAPLVGRWFASSATAPTAAPAPSSAPARPEMFFKLSEPGPENMAENSTGQPKSSSSAERLNGVNTFTGGAVVNAGALTLDDLETIDGRTTGKGDRLNLGVAMQESRAQNALGLPTESANKNGDLAYNNSGQMLASGLRNDQNGEVLQAELARRPSRQMLIESAHRLDGDTNNNPAPAPVVAMATTQPGMVARFAYAYVVTNAVSLNVSASTQKVELSDSLQPAPAAVIADRQVLKPPQPAPIPQPEFLTRENAFSTFSMNVSDVSFKLAQASLQNGRMP